MPIPCTVDESSLAGGGGVTSARRLARIAAVTRASAFGNTSSGGAAQALRGVVAGVWPRCGRARQHARRARRPTLRRRLAAHDRAAPVELVGEQLDNVRDVVQTACCVQASPGFQEGAPHSPHGQSNTARGCRRVDDARSELRPATRRTTLGAQWSALSAANPAQRFEFDAVGACLRAEAGDLAAAAAIARQLAGLGDSRPSRCLSGLLISGGTRPSRRPEPEAVTASVAFCATSSALSPTSSPTASKPSPAPSAHPINETTRTTSVAARAAIRSATTSSPPPWLTLATLAQQRIGNGPRPSPLLTDHEAVALALTYEPTCVAAAAMPADLTRSGTPRFGHRRSTTRFTVKPPARSPPRPSRCDYRDCCATSERP